MRIDHSFSIEKREDFLKQFGFRDSHGVLLQTCDRIEFYYGSGVIPLDTVRHLFRVVSGLESRLVGENAIQNQVKEAYVKARERFPLSKELHLLFQRALYVGKRVRSSTDISKGAVSHSQLVVEKIKRLFSNVDKIHFTLIGVNKVNEDILKYLSKNKISSIVLANRSMERALEIAKKYPCIIPLPLRCLKTALKDTDVLISSTSAPHLIVKKEDIPLDRRIVIFDLAVPRDVEPAVKNFANATLYNIEDIEAFCEDNLVKRSEEIDAAERIIEEEVDMFFYCLERRERVCHIG